MIERIRIAVNQTRHNRFLARQGFRVIEYNPATRKSTIRPNIQSGGDSTNPVIRIIRWLKEFKIQLQQARKSQAPVKTQELQEPIVTTTKENIKFN